MEVKGAKTFINDEEIHQDLTYGKKEQCKLCAMNSGIAEDGDVLRGLPEHCVQCKLRRGCKQLTANLRQPRAEPEVSKQLGTVNVTWMIRSVVPTDKVGDTGPMP